MTNSDICGGREDNPTGWNDITKRGFSVIITNDIEGFNAYRARVKSYKTSLSSDLEKLRRQTPLFAAHQQQTSLKRLLQKLRAHFHRRCRRRSLWRPIIRSGLRWKHLPTAPKTTTENSNSRQNYCGSACCNSTYHI